MATIKSAERGLHLPGYYKLVKAPDNYPGHIYRSNSVLEHHLNWWLSTGNIVPKGMVIHHKNHDKGDNRIENLELMTTADHAREHALIGRDFTDVVCNFCGSEFEKETRQIKPGQENFYCSRSHQARDGFAQSRIKKDVGHGTTMYQRGCRCDLCKDANRIRNLKLRQAKKSSSL